MQLKKSVIKVLLSYLILMCYAELLKANEFDETRRYNYFAQFKPSEPFIALNNDARINLLLMLGQANGIKVLNQDYALKDYINLNNDRMLNSYPANTHNYSIDSIQKFETASHIYTKYLKTALNENELRLSEQLYLVTIYPLLLNTTEHFAIPIFKNPTEKFNQHILLLSGISYYRQENYIQALNNFSQVNLKNGFLSELASYYAILAIDKIQQARHIPPLKPLGYTHAKTADEYKENELFESSVVRINQHIEGITFDLHIENYKENFKKPDFLRSLMRYKYKNQTRIYGKNLESSLAYFNQTLADIVSFGSAIYWVNQVNQEIFKVNDTTSIRSDQLIGVVDTIRLLRKFKNKEALNNLNPISLMARVNYQVELLKANQKNDLALLLELYAYHAFNNERASAYHTIQRLEAYPLSKPEENSFVQLALWNLKADAYEAVNIYAKSVAIWEMLSGLELSSSQLFYVQTRLANTTLLQNRFDFQSLLAMQQKDQFSNLMIRAAIYRQIETPILIELLIAFDKQLPDLRINYVPKNTYKNDWDVIYGSTDFDVIAEILITRHAVAKDVLFFEKYKDILKKSDYWQLNIEEMLWGYGHFLSYLSQASDAYNTTYFFRKCSTIGDNLEILIQNGWKNSKAQFCWLGAEFIFHKTKPLRLLPSRELAIMQGEFDTPVNTMLLSIATNEEIGNDERKLAFKTLVDCNTKGNLQDFFRYSCEVKADSERLKYEWINLYRDYFNENLIYQNPSTKVRQ